MKRLMILSIAFITLSLYACGGGEHKPIPGTEPKTEAATSASDNGGTNPSYDPERGEGKFTKVDIPAKVDATMAASGEKIYSVKCGSCHKLTGEKLVGPGWKGVTTRHKPEWIMNFITNPDAMIDKDPKVQAQLEICMVRMPNQSLSDDEARNLYEFMRKNDGVK